MADYTADRYELTVGSSRQFFSGRSFDVFLALRGAGSFRCGEVRLVLGQENLVIFKPGKSGTLEAVGSRGVLELIRVQLPPETLRALSDEKTDLAAGFGNVPAQQVSVRTESNLIMLLKSIARRLLDFAGEKDEFGAELFQNGLLQMFAVLTVRACIRADLSHAHMNRHKLMLEEVFLYIQEHLTEDLSLERLEKHFFISHEHISREFKRQTGQTVHAYIVKMRLEQCCRLIQQGYPMTEVYKMGGFGGYNHFFRAFKKEFGVTPGQYARLLREGGGTK